MSKASLIICWFSVCFGVLGMYPNKKIVSEGQKQKALFPSEDSGNSLRRRNVVSRGRLSGQKKLTSVKRSSRFFKQESRICKDRSFFTGEEVERICAQLKQENQELDRRNQELDRRSQELDRRNQELDRRNQELNEQNQKSDERNQALLVGNKFLAAKSQSLTIGNSKILKSLRDLATSSSDNNKPYLKGMSDYCRDIIGYNSEQPISDGPMELFNNVKHEQMQVCMSGYRDEDLQWFLPEFVEFTVNSFKDGVNCLCRVEQKIQKQYRKQQGQIQDLSNQNREQQGQIQNLSNQNREQQGQIQDLSNQNGKLQCQVQDLSNQNQKQQDQIYMLLEQNKGLQQQIQVLQQKYNDLEEKVQSGQVTDNEEGTSLSAVEGNNNPEGNPDMIMTAKNDNAGDVSLNNNWSFHGQIEKSMPNGVGRFYNENMGVYIEGNFVSGRLKIEESIKFKGMRGREKEFRVENLCGGEYFLPEKYLLQAKESVNFSNYLCLLLSETEGVIFDKGFVYWGQLDGDNLPRGSGMMIRSTGEVRQGFLSRSDWLRGG